MSTEVSETKSNSKSIDFSKDADLGFEGITSQDLAIPYLVLLQKTSPQLENVEGAKAGMIYNTVSNDLYESLEVVPCAYKRVFVEWKPRETGGGYVGEHPIGSDQSQKARNDRGEIILDNGNNLIETAYYFVLLKNNEQAVISMSSTQLKKARRWNSMMMGLKIEDSTGKFVTPPSFSHRYKLTSMQEKNDKGSWFGWNIEVEKPVTEQLQYETARSFHEGVSKDQVKLAPPSKTESSESETTGDF